MTSNTIRNNERIRSRSNTGCLTCRRRKKKCDETGYPVCRNCSSKHLDCKWSDKSHILHKHLSHVRYLGGDEQKETKNTIVSKPAQSECTLECTPVPEVGFVLENLDDQLDITNTKNFEAIDIISKDTNTYDVSKLSNRFDESNPQLNEITNITEKPLNKTDDTYMNQFVDFKDKESFRQRIAMQQDIVDE